MRVACDTCAPHRRHAVAAHARRRHPPLHAARLDGPPRDAVPRVHEQTATSPTSCTSAATATCAATTTCSSSGQNVMYANAELRFPIIEAALTPIGVIGGIRGVFFAGVGGAWFSNQKTASPCTGERDGFRFVANFGRRCARCRHRLQDRPVRPTDLRHRSGHGPADVCRCPTTARRRSTGFRLQDGRASYGIGLETFALGFPIHFDWSWRTLVNKDWENVVFSCVVRHSRRRVRQRRRRVPEAALRGLDRLRFLTDPH